MSTPAYRDLAVPEQVAAPAAAWLRTAEQDRVVAPARPSATVMLLREVGAEVEVFVLRRAAGMAFASGMLAFPGGGVDVRDADPQVPWAGPGPRHWAQRLGTGEDRARELVAAAAREVFEECGVLLAGGTPGTVVDDLTDPSWARERQALLARTQSFGQMLARLGLVVRSDLLAARAHWITPDCEPRRYDTHFLAARMPDGQVADDLSTEAQEAGWATPAALLAAHAAGEAAMLPPTQVVLEELARIGPGELDAWLARPVPVRPVHPWPVQHSGALWMRCPVGGD